MPTVLPSPAAPMTMPSSTSGRQSPIGFSRSRNAMNMIRNPESHRGPQLARSANATAAGTWGRAALPVAGIAFVPVGPGPRARATSPWLESTFAGSRIARIVAMTNRTNA